MPPVDAALVALLPKLFGAPELRRLLQRESWGADLAQHLAPSEHQAPSAWFHDLVLAVDQRGLRDELQALLLRERGGRAAEILAVLPDVPSPRLALPLPRASTPIATPRAIAPPQRPNSATANTRPAPRGWSPIRLIHLSDLHFSTKTAWDAGTVLGRLAADVASLRAEVGEIDLVVLTGDIANHGLAEEYAQASAWLAGPLAQAAGVGAAMIRVVPGNHDVHRASIGRSARMVADGLLRDPDPQQAIAEMLDDPTERAPLLARQAAYLTFAKNFHPSLTAPWWFERPAVRGLTLHLAGFNSAWLSSDDNDLGRLLVSRWQCHQLLAGAEEADLSIALLHHPWSYLHEQDQGVVEEEIRRRCGVILHGHLHQQKARLTSDPDRDVLQLAAGASYAGSRWANAYQLLELDPMRGEARVHFRLWDGHDWIPDRNRAQKAPDGVATLPLRRSPKAPTPRHMTPAELALAELCSEEFTTPAINAWLSADPRRAPARSALAQGGEDQNYPFDLLAVTLTQLGLVDEALFTSLIHERPQSADAAAEAARACGVRLPTIVRSLAAEAKPVNKRSRYSRLELVVELEELQKRRARSRRNQHDHDGLDEEINEVVRRLLDAPPPHKGAEVAGATLEKVVASGAFGTVWRGRALDGQAVAVKVFRPEQLKAQMAAWGFRRGVRAMRLFERRRGPASLVRVLSVSEDELAFTMPFINGATLEATDLTGWTLPQRLDCFQAIGEAIQFAHDVQVIHRDLKPANIMIDRSGAPVVIDFDAADVGHATLLSMAINVGTLEYMAPEQPRAVQASVLMDVYSLGRVLHFLLLGGHSKSYMPLEPIVRSELSTTPPALVELVLRACSPTPEARPASVAELLRELGVARAVPGTADPPVLSVRAGAKRVESPVPPPREVAPPERPEPPRVAAGAAQVTSPDAEADGLVIEIVPPGPPAQGAVRLPPPPPSAPPLSAPIVSETLMKARPYQPAPPKAPLSETSDDSAELPAAPKRAPPSWGWRGFGALVVVLSAVAACVNFGDEETPPATAEPVAEVAPTPVEPEPVAEVAPTPVIIGPCEIPAIGGPTGKTHKPEVAGLNMPFVGLSDGQFCMGSAEGVGSDDEQPQYPVKVSGFLLGKSEVTQAQWRAVVKAAKAAKDVDASSLNENPSTLKGDKLPVEKVSWCDVTRFANALSRLDGRAPVYEITPDAREAKGCTVGWLEGANGYRLPTEAEWEYATRAGSTTAYATGDDEAALAEAGWYGSDSDDYFDESGNSGGKPHAVCTAPKQPWGLCDLHGNVLEWVFDVYDRKTYARRAAAAAAVEPGRSMFDGSLRLAEAAASEAPRVLRGGSWNDWFVNARSAFRYWYKPSSTDARIGFRLVLPSSEGPRP